MESATLQKFAAIDIGSNATKFLICSELGGTSTPIFKRELLLQIPIRLGSDSFEYAKIKPTTLRRLADALRACTYLAKAYGVRHLKACATAALREAQNQKQALRYLKKETGIAIELISGGQEAALLFQAQKHTLGKLVHHALLADMGGGSLELTLCREGKAAAARSFHLGAVRILQQGFPEAEWHKLLCWLLPKIKGQEAPLLIASGGNITCLHDLLQHKTNKPISYSSLDKLVAQLKRYSYKQRIQKFQLNANRADVIVPAGELFLALMEAMQTKKLYVPGIGLSDGIILSAYHEYLLRKEAG